jgi:DNA repair protein RadD
VASVTLRPYQTEGVEAIRASFARGNRRVLYVAPTGSGKTALFSYIAAGVWRNGKRVTVLCHRDFLLDQVSSALKMNAVPHGLLIGGSYGLPRAPVVVASVFTLANRLQHFKSPDLIVADEAHHLVGGSTWAKVMAAYPQARMLGVTATPERLDGRGLNESFDDMVVGPSTADLIDQGYLAPPEVYAPATLPDLQGVRSRAGDFAVGELSDAMDRPSITGDAVAHYNKLAPGKRAVAFCCSVQHATDVAAGFQAAGIPAATVNGKMERGLIRRTMARFAAGDILVLTAADLISEGYDVPGIEAAILLRPTKSLGLYLQQVGRSLRPAPGKDRAIILDHAGNSRGDRHGLPDAERHWSLMGRAAREAGEKAAPTRQCEQCYAVHRPAPKCPRCGFVYPIRPRTVEEVEGDLVRVTPAADVDAVTDDMDAKRRKYFTLRGVARKRKYQNPSLWAFSQICADEYRRILRARQEPPGAVVNGLSEDERIQLWHHLEIPEDEVPLPRMGYGDD